MLDERVFVSDSEGEPTMRATLFAGLDREPEGQVTDLRITAGMLRDHLAETRARIIRIRERRLRELGVTPSQDAARPDGRRNRGGGRRRFRVGACEKSSEVTGAAGRGRHPGSAPVCARLHAR